MPFDIGALGMGAANAVIGTGMGLLLEGHNDRRQLKQQGKLQAQQIQGQKEMTDYNMAKQLEMWKNTSYGPQKEQMKAAGINPALMYGMGGGGGQTAGSASGSVGGASANQNPGEIGMGIQTAMQMQLLKAQKENIEADTENKKANTTKTSGVDTKNVEASTEQLKQLTSNAKIQQLIDRVKLSTDGIANSYADERNMYEVEKLRMEYSTLLEELQPLAQTNEIMREHIKTFESYVIQTWMTAEWMNEERKAGIKLTQEQTKTEWERRRQIMQDVYNSLVELQQTNTALTIDMVRNTLINKGIEWGAASQMAGSLLKMFTKTK